MSKSFQNSTRKKYINPEELNLMTHACIDTNKKSLNEELDKYYYLKSLSISACFQQNFNLIDLLRFKDSLTTLSIRNSYLIINFPLIPIFKNLTSLTIDNLFNRHSIDISPIAHLPKLTSLNLTGTRFSNSEIILQLTQLTSLSLVFSQELETINISTLTNLTCLKVEYSHFQDTNQLSCLKNLTTLTLDGTNLTDMRIISKLDKLIKLNVVFDNDYQPEYFNSIFTLSKLEDLAVNHTGTLNINDHQDTTLNNLTHLSLSEIYAIDINNTLILQNLTSLTLYKVFALDLDFNLYFNLNFISNLQQLRILKLIEIDFNGAKEELNKIGDLQNLTQLDLISLDGINNISPINKLVNLETLTLVDLKINDLSPISSLTNLKYLTLFNSPDINSIIPILNLKKLSHLEIDTVIYADFNPISQIASLRHLLFEHSHKKYYSRGTKYHNSINERKGELINISKKLPFLIKCVYNYLIDEEIELKNKVDDLLDGIKSLMHIIINKVNIIGIEKSYLFHPAVRKLITDYKEIKQETYQYIEKYLSYNETHYITERIKEINFKTNNQHSLCNQNLELTTKYLKSLQSFTKISENIYEYIFSFLTDDEKNAFCSIFMDPEGLKVGDDITKTLLYIANNKILKCFIPNNTSQPKRLAVTQCEYAAYEPKPHKKIKLDPSLSPDDPMDIEAQTTQSSCLGYSVEEPNTFG